MHTLVRRAIVCTALLLGMGSAALAQAPYPSKPIRVVVPYPPGGATDIMARTVAQRLTEVLGQQVVIDNKAGASGAIGAELGAKAAPDGYTLIMGNISTLAINPVTFAKLAYDPITSFDPVSMVAVQPLLIAVNPEVPAKTLAELVQLAKSRPGQLNYGTAGSSIHLAVEQFSTQAGIRMNHVPYKGSAGAVNDLISGEVSAMFSSLPSLQGLADKGMVKVLAATAPSKSAATKSLPLISTSLPGFDYTTWYAMYAPLATPKPIVDSINAALNKALKNTAMVAKIEAAGTELQPGSPEDVMAWTQRDTDKWARVIRDAKISVE